MNELIMNSGLQQMDIHVTKHAYTRLKERAGLCRKAAERISAKAYEYGIQGENTNGRLHSYLSGRDHKNDSTPGTRNARVYGEMVYIFNVCEEQSEVTVITAYHLPNELKQQARGCFRRRRLA